MGVSSSQGQRNALAVIWSAVAASYASQGFGTITPLQQIKGLPLDKAWYEYGKGRGAAAIARILRDGGF